MNQGDSPKIIHRSTKIIEAKMPKLSLKVSLSKTSFFQNFYQDFPLKNEHFEKQIQRSLAASLVETVVNYCDKSLLSSAYFKDNILHMKLITG